jgi:hypothetical protein
MERRRYQATAQNHFSSALHQKQAAENELKSV